jgi:hypothetical protein
MAEIKLLQRKTARRPVVAIDLKVRVASARGPGRWDQGRISPTFGNLANRQPQVMQYLSSIGVGGSNSPFEAA